VHWCTASLKAIGTLVHHIVFPGHLQRAADHVGRYLQDQDVVDRIAGQGGDSIAQQRNVSVVHEGKRDAHSTHHELSQLHLATDAETLRH
jgi:hypothetical protein